MIKFWVFRNAGHPWDGRAGFDHLEVMCDSETELNRFVQSAVKKLWATWLIGGPSEGHIGGPCEGLIGFGGLLYKPCDIEVPWSDDPTNRHTGCVRTLAKRPNDSSQELEML